MSENFRSIDACNQAIEKLKQQLGEQTVASVTPQMLQAEKNRLEELSTQYKQIKQQLTSATQQY